MVMVVVVVAEVGMLCNTSYERENFVVRLFCLGMGSNQYEKQCSTSINTDDTCDT